MISGNDRGAPIIRKAQLEDLDDIKRLVDQHKQELGFVIRGALARSIETSEVFIALGVSKELIGFVHYRHRRDHQTTLYNIVVEPDFQRQGVGTQLLDTLRDDAKGRAQTFILLKCPQELPANKFYKEYGFKLIEVDEGKKRPLTIWQLYL